jgi:hypothetical protein
MTTDDPARLAACFEVLAKVPTDGPGEHDFAGLWSLAGRIASMEAAPADLRTRAAKARAGVEKLATDHVAALALPEKLVLEKKPWVGHLPVFLRAFQGVPAREELERRLADPLATQRKQAVAHLRKYFPALEKGSSSEAFEEGVAAATSGFLWHECWSLDFRKNLRAWRGDAKKLKLGRSALAAYDASFEGFEKSIADGWKAFEDVNRKYSGD